EGDPARPAALCGSHGPLRSALGRRCRGPQGGDSPGRAPTRNRGHLGGDGAGAAGDLGPADLRSFSMRDLTIRRATIDDLEAVVPLFDAYRQFYRQPPDLGRAREFLRERLSQRDTMVFVAALEHEAELAG